MAILKFPNFKNGKIQTIESSNLGPGGTFWGQGGTKIKKSKKIFFNKTYQVDTSQKGKIERNTIKILSDRLEVTIKSY